MTPEEKTVVERACERLIKQFAFFSDLGDIDALADLFAENGLFARPADPGNPIVGKEKIRAVMKARPPRVSRHLVTNILIDVVDTDEATGKSYVTLLTSSDVDGKPPIVADPKFTVGEMTDTFVRTQAGWRFTARRGTVALFFNH
jgi:hypothetical protein